MVWLCLLHEMGEFQRTAVWWPGIQREYGDLPHLNFKDACKRFGLTGTWMLRPGRRWQSCHMEEGLQQEHAKLGKLQKKCRFCCRVICNSDAQFLGTNPWSEPDEGAPKSAAALMTNMHHLTAPLSRIQMTKPEDKSHDYPKKKKGWTVLWLKSIQNSMRHSSGLTV